MSIVSVVKTASNPAWPEVDRAVRLAIDLAGGIPCGHGDMVLLKPNLVAVPPVRDSGVITRVEVARSVADAVMDAGGKPVIAESAGVGSDTASVMSFAGYDDLVRAGYHVVDLKKTRAVSVDLKGVPGMKSVKVFRLALEADSIITLPVMKTHDQTEVTLSLKNLKGLIADSGKMAMHHHGLFDGVVALAEALGPMFSVMDAITGQEGVGPIYGDPVDMNLVLASPDPVAMDATAGRLMGYEPEEVPITLRAAQRGLGTLNPRVVGEEPAQVGRRFRRASEVSGEALGSGYVLFGDDACTGCRNTVLSVIWALKRLQQMNLLEGRTLVSGRALAGEGSVLVGRCACEANPKGVKVPGCPPENQEIIDALHRISE